MNTRCGLARLGTAGLLALILAIATTAQAQDLAGPCASMAPCEVQYGFSHGIAPATFHWGWFGAGRYEAPEIWHYDYCGRKIRWTYRPGF